MATADQRKSIFFIDDDPTQIAIVRNILDNAFGLDIIEFKEALSAETGISLINQSPPDIVVCDIHMPGINGFDFCRRIRKSGFQSTVILMSAYDENEDYALQAKEAGADAFLTKPVKKGELLFIVNLILRVDYLNETVISKNKELENSLSELKQAHQKMSELNSELMKDKKRLNSNLKDMTGMNKRLEAQNREISTIHHEVHRRFDSTVGLLTNIIELNQSSRRGHSERVAEISAFIATQMGLTKIQIENIRTAARLHEIGIVSLPRDESIEDALDESHSRHLTSHPLVAEMLLKGFPGFEEIADIIRHMHENVDGTGKPDGLSGEAIPMGSRILSAASFYDHFQVEHPDSPVGEVLQKVEKESGRWFDENVVSFLSEYARILNPDKNETTIHCSVFALKEGMELASDIYSESGINLLRRGTVLDKEMVTRILKFNNVDPIAGQVVVKG